MLALFRNNHSTTVFILALLAALLHLPAVIGWVTPPPAAPEGEGGLLFGTVLGWTKPGAGYSALVATVLVFFQALLVNRLADHFRLLQDRSWYPGAFYVIAASCLPEFLFLSPVLVAVTFIPLALRPIFSVYKQTTAFGAIFDSAFWITLATLIHPPAVWCLPAAYLALFNLRSFSIREQLVFFSGVFVPFFLALSWYFWYDQAGLFLKIQFSEWIFWPAFELPTDLYSSIKTGLIGLLLLVTLFSFNVYYYKKLIQVQKYVTIFYWFLFAGLIAALFHYDWRPDYFLLLMPSMSVFLAYLFESIRNKALAEIFYLAFIAAIFLLQFFPH